MDRALLLNPNLARSWNLSAWVRIWLGQPELGIEHVARAMRLSPLDPGFHTMESTIAFAHLRADRYDEASLWAERALCRQPNAPEALRALAIGSALAGDLENYTTLASLSAALWRIRRASTRLEQHIP